MFNRTTLNPSDTEIVWDGFVRIFHWSIVIGYLLNQFVIADNNPLHNWIGYYILALIVLRIIWGFYGSHHARFENFIPDFKSLTKYLIDLIHLRESDYRGHNPAGAVMICILILLMTTICISGWMMGLDIFWGVDWVEDLHYYSSKALLYLMFIHLAGVIYASVRHKQNLILSMITGRKSK